MHHTIKTLKKLHDLSTMRRALQATTGTVLLSPAIKALKTRETLDETTLTAIAATTMTSRSEWNTRHAVSYRQGNWPRDPRDVESSSSSYERQTCYELTEQHGTSESTALTTEWTPTPSNCSRPSKSRYPDSVASTFLYRENYVRRHVDSWQALSGINTLETKVSTEPHDTYYAWIRKTA